ncbi:MAG: NAD(P)/FAD-dependent oxidoreductase [Fimbriimonadaceae bacterium]
MLTCDVAIIGGGPAGSTVGTLLKKYNPTLDVVILERENFPRDHVGESHLPAISRVLVEMGVWEKVEAADFPIKIGATFKWGVKNDLWHTDFVQGKDFIEEPRPAKFAGQRVRTAFQVDRSKYDTILLDHAHSMGVRVLAQTKVVDVHRHNDRITMLDVVSRVSPDVSEVEARYYVDCSGEAGILRRAMGVKVESPTALRNIAIWKYWNDAQWAVTIGIGGTRVQIMSLHWGWVWFIPITPTRTSIGLVVPAAYYKKSGKSTEELYAEAIAQEPMISKLVANATPEPELSATKDWSFVAERMVGENWFLAGDACGFADPILSAGMTLAHTSARKVAYTILELERRQLDPAWVKSEYSAAHRDQIRHHMQFADYWYSSNAGFTDLKEYCAEIAESAGITLRPEAAFQWLATGGFAIEEPGTAGALTYRLGGLKALAENLGDAPSPWELSKTNFWTFDNEGVVESVFPRYVDGRILPIPCLRRGAKLLPVSGAFEHVLNAMTRSMDSVLVLEDCVNAMIREDGVPVKEAPSFAIEAIESMLLEGWIKAEAIPTRPFIKVRNDVVEGLR